MIHLTSRASTYGHGMDPAATASGTAEMRRSVSEEKPSPPGETKRRRIERGKKACLPCRSRKCKCGGAPPEPCPNCVSDSIECQWPTEDGRSSEARKERARQRRLQAMAVRGLGRPPPKAERDTSKNVEPATMDQQWFAQEGGFPGLMGQPPFTPMPSGSQSDQFMPHMDHSWLDPEQFILAMSSQLPMVEEGSTLDESSPATGSSTAAKARQTTEGDSDRIVKITWWRPHGPTAIAPGLKRFSLKVRVQPDQTSVYPSPSAFPNVGSADEMFGANNMPAVPIMRHLIEVFGERMGCQFPFLELPTLYRDLESGEGSVFLFNCIAATAARFSTHPALALPHLKPYEYGNIFYQRAKSLLPSMIAVPSRETVIALVLMAHIGFGNDSEPEEWMFTGMAVRMAIDLGLHLDPSDASSISAEENRLNCLAFWSVLIMDYALSFGTGRQTTFRYEEITRRLPTEEDVHPSNEPATRSPFVYAARQMLTYGPLINLLNGPVDDPTEVEKDISAARGVAIAEYHNLPADMQWSATNLQLHKQAHQDSIFLHIHLWMHCVIASAYLTGGEHRRHHPAASHASGTSTPVVAASANVWRNSARTIGDILVLSDVINPYAYYVLPFANQAFHVAGCCYIKEIELHKNTDASDESPSDKSKDSKQVDLFRSMLTSVATTSISTLQQGLTKQTPYWSGVQWVVGTLAQRAAGIRMPDLDISEVQEKLQTYVSMPDTGLVGRRTSEKDSSSAPDSVPPLDAMDFTNLDLLTLPFDLGTVFPHNGMNIM